MLFENHDASNGAFLVDPVLTHRALPPYPGCAHDRLLCKDLGTFATLRDRDVVAIERGSNEIRVTWPPASEPRLLVVTEMHRPAWKATAGGQTLTPRSVYGGFIGVLTPAGVSSVQLRYRPDAIVAASIACYAALIVSLAVLVGTGRRNHHVESDRAVPQ